MPQAAGRANAFDLAGSFCRQIAMHFLGRNAASNCRREMRASLQPQLRDFSQFSLTDRKASAQLHV
jgi:hypothetical protein